MFIDYNKILKNNLEKVLYDVLSIVVKKGLKEGHHLFITFDPNHKNVGIPAWLKKKHKKIMTVVIQYEFWDLKVYKDKFSIILSFDNIKANIVVPFNAIISFADPYANFGLKILNYEQKKFKLNKTKKSNKVIKFENYTKD